MSIKKVAVIGAGVSGLTAMKACEEQGLDTICFEMHDNIGGLWYYTDHPREDEGAVVYENLIANTSREMMRFSDFHFPHDTPPFPLYQQVLQYLHSYAEKYKLKSKIHLNTKIVELKKAEDYKETGRWVIKSQKVGESSVVTHTFDTVMYCVGFHRKPVIPQIDGLKDFQGTWSHSKTFRTGKIYKDQRVLVIGNANSACDTAVGISDYSKQVYLSVGKGTWIYPRYADRMPIDAVFVRRMYDKLPESFVSNKLQGIADNYYNNEEFGFRPGIGPTHFVPVANDEIGSRIASGKVKVISRTIRFLKDGVQLEGGKYVHDIDHILFATGFEPDVNLLDRDYVMNAYKNVFPVNLTHATLAMVGLISTAGPVPPVAEMQARFASLVFAGKHNLPKQTVMIKDVDKWKSFREKMYGPGKHWIPSLTICDEIASEIGVKPSFTRLLFKSPSVALQSFFGPAFVAQYRLQGRGSMDSAFDDCKRAWKLTSQGIKLRTVPKYGSDSSILSFQFLLYSVAIFSVVLSVYCSVFLSITK